MDHGIDVYAIDIEIELERTRLNRLELERFAFRCMLLLLHVWTERTYISYSVHIAPHLDHILVPFDGSH